MVTRFRNRALFAQDCTQESLAQRNPVEKRFPFACLPSQSLLEGTGHFARTGAALKRRWPLAPGPGTGKPASLRGGIDRDLRGLDRYLSHSGGGDVTFAVHASRTTIALAAGTNRARMWAGETELSDRTGWDWWQRLNASPWVVSCRSVSASPRSLPRLRY
jgi:hypothetical protein